MFQANLHFRDIGSPHDIVGGGIFFGGSSILPVQHRMLHTLVVDSPQRLAIVTYERFADSPQGVLHNRVSDAALQSVSDALDDYLLDFAALVIDKSRRTVRYRASPVITVPIYLRAGPDAVAIDWDYTRLLDGYAVEPVKAQVLAQVAGFSTYGPETIVSGLWRATANATLVATPAGVSVELPAPVAHDAAQDLPPDVDVEARLIETVATIIAARPIVPAATAVELSGGMDSALTALATASVAGPGLLSTGAQFDGAMGDAQAARRRMLRVHGRFDDLAVPAERFAPFGPASARRRPYGVLPDDENYPELFEAIFALLQRGGFDTLVSGFGGDELYPRYPGEPGAAPIALPTTSPMVTSQGLAIARSAMTDYPLGWLQETCWQSTAGRSQRLLRYGLWPVYPYINVALARFVSRLPHAYRHDRTLLRSTLTRVLGDPVFDTDYVKERFGPVARRGIAENRDYLIDLVRRSPLMRYVEIDASAIHAALTTDVDALPPCTYEALFRVLKVLSFFQSDRQR